MKTPREILEGIVGLEFCFGHKERTGQYITNNICNDCGLPIAKKKQDYIDQALSALREVVLGKKKEAKYIDSPEAIRFNNEQYLKTEGYNQALQDIANLFGGEK